LSLVVLVLAAWFGLLVLGVLVVVVTATMRERATMRARIKAKHRGLAQSSVGQGNFRGF
jgi:ABC-type protease/lipase transport system fused ATPase/permease subunit